MNAPHSGQSSQLLSVLLSIERMGQIVKENPSTMYLRRNAMGRRVGSVLVQIPRPRPSYLCARVLTGRLSATNLQGPVGPTPCHHVGEAGTASDDISPLGIRP